MKQIKSKNFNARSFSRFFIFSSVHDGILSDNPHLVLLFYLSQLFLRELFKSYRLIQVVPMDMSGYYGKYEFVSFTNGKFASNSVEKETRKFLKMSQTFEVFEKYTNKKGIGRCDYSFVSLFCTYKLLNLKLLFKKEKM